MAQMEICLGWGDRLKFSLDSRGTAKPLNGGPPPQRADGVISHFKANKLTVVRADPEGANILRRIGVKCKIEPMTAPAVSPSL